MISIQTPYDLTQYLLQKMIVTVERLAMEQTESVQESAICIIDSECAGDALLLARAHGQNEHSGFVEPSTTFGRLMSDSIHPSIWGHYRAIRDSLGLDTKLDPDRYRELTVTLKRPLRAPEGTKSYTEWACNKLVSSFLDRLIRLSGKKSASSTDIKSCIVSAEEGLDHMRRLGLEWDEPRMVEFYDADDKAAWALEKAKGIREQKEGRAENKRAQAKEKPKRPLPQLTERQRGLMSKLMNHQLSPVVDPSRPLECSSSDRRTAVALKNKGLIEFVSGSKGEPGTFSILPKDFGLEYYERRFKETAFTALAGASSSDSTADHLSNEQLSAMEGEDAQSTHDSATPAQEVDRAESDSKTDNSRASTKNTAANQSASGTKKASGEGEADEETQDETDSGRGEAADASSVPASETQGETGDASDQDGNADTVDAAGRDDTSRAADSDPNDSMAHSGEQNASAEPGSASDSDQNDDPKSAEEDQKTVGQDDDTDPQDVPAPRKRKRVQKKPRDPYMLTVSQKQFLLELYDSDQWDGDAPSSNVDPWECVPDEKRLARALENKKLIELTHDEPEPDNPDGFCVRIKPEGVRYLLDRMPDKLKT